MPRWFALCQGLDLPACHTCRRLAALYPADSTHATQSWTKPDVTGTHCNSYIERPAHVIHPHTTDENP